MDATLRHSSVSGVISQYGLVLRNGFGAILSFLPFRYIAAGFDATFLLFCCSIAETFYEANVETIFSKERMLCYQSGAVYPLVGSSSTDNSLLILEKRKDNFRS